MTPRDTRSRLYGGAVGVAIATDRPSRIGLFYRGICRKIGSGRIMEWLNARDQTGCGLCNIGLRRDES